MRISEILKNIPHEGSGNAEISSIEYDSRKAGEGSLFVCLRGANVDGHKFAPMAYKNGCRAFLCEEKMELPADAEQFVCENTRAALAVASAEFYGHPADELHLIGITGSKGKTTTSLLIHSILNAHGRNCAYIGSNGVIINGKTYETANTTPESHVLHHLFRNMVNEGVKYVVLEVSSQALARNRVDGIKFDTVVFTNICEEDHIGPGEHPDYEDYKNSKAKLFTDTYGARFAVYNADEEEKDFMLRDFHGEKISFAMKNASDYKGENKDIYRSETALGVSFDCITAEDNVHVRLMSPGAFSIYNGLAAIAVCGIYGVDCRAAAETLEHTPVQGRFEIVEARPGRTYIIDYSHNGMALTKALKALREYEPKRIICVFGSVGGRTQCRRSELAIASSEYADYSIITSDNPDFESPEAIVEEIASHMKEGSAFECVVDRSEAIKRAVEIAEDGDIVLFAGKGHENYQLVCGQKVPFSEREKILWECNIPEVVI